MRSMKIVHDLTASNPRDDENLGTMICFHNKYRMGDKHLLTVQSARKLESSKDVISLPIFMLDHSGVSISTQDFNDMWDSGKLGFIYVDRKKVREEYDVSRITPHIMACVVKSLSEEVKIYNAFLNDEVFGYITYICEGDAMDSCWNFYMLGTKDELINDCLESAGYDKTSMKVFCDF